MSYSDFISKAIKNSGYSQKQITIMAKNRYNIDIDPSYISKLQNGKKIASKEINEAIAKVCKIEPKDLQFEADMERAPESVRKTMINIVEVLKLTLLRVMNKNDNEYEILKRAMEEMSTRQMVELMAKNNFFDKNEIELNPFKKEINNNDLDKLSMQVTTNYKMNDGSMLPLINEGAQLMLDKTDNIKNGDIVLVQDNNNNILVRMYNKIDDIVSLIPMNKKFETIQFKKDDMIIRAIVTGYIVDFYGKG